MTKEEKQQKAELSRKDTWKRAEKYYPNAKLKKDLNTYSLHTGEHKSELAVRLMKSFFAARREQGKYPTVVKLLNK